MRKRKEKKKKKRKCGSAQPTRSIRCPAEHEWLVGWHGHRHSRDTAGTKGVEEDHDKQIPYRCPGLRVVSNRIRPGHRLQGSIGRLGG